MNKIVLVYPKTGIWEKMSLRLPLSLLHIAAVLKRDGFNVRIIDQRVDANWETSLKKEIDNKPLFIGTTAMTGSQIYYALQISQLVKRISSVPVVLGGIHISLMPEQTIQNELIDIGVIGEGETTVVELAQNISDKKSLNSIPGLIFKENGQIVKSSKRSFIRDLDVLPDIPYELVDVERYTSFNYQGERSLDLVTSRGCPFNCYFCYNTVFNNSKWRSHSAERVIEKIEYINKKFGVRNIFFQDDNFSANVRRIAKIVEKILKKGIKIKFGLMGARIDTLKQMNDDLLKSLQRAGCINIDIGVESGSNRVLEKISKGITVEDIWVVNERLKKYDFIIKYTFITGFPGELDEEISQTIDLAMRLTKSNKYAYSPFYIATPYPGTDLYQEGIENGFVPPKTFDEWAFFDRDLWYKNYPSWLSKERIHYLEMITFISFFASKNIRFKINNRLFKKLFDLYHPIAHYRFENKYFSYPIELELKKILTRHR